MAYERPNRKPATEYRFYLSGDTVSMGTVAQILAEEDFTATVFDTYGVWDGGRENGVCVFMTEVDETEVRRAIQALKPLGIEEVLLMENPALLSHVAV